MAITSFDVTCEKKVLKKYEPKSPYLNSDKVQLLSRVTEKRLVKKKTLDYVSSFPLATNIYKANSDEFKLKRGNKKIKKSVLTLPNQLAPSPQVCTVSDMNDSEYYSQSNSNTNNKPRVKKRSGIKNVRKTRVKNKEFEFCDRDEQFCSQFNINLDSSSTEIIKKYKDNVRRNSNVMMQKVSKSSCLPSNADMKPHDVWAVLRNLNRFPFRPSPPMSEESIIGTKKKKSQKKRINKDTRVYETEEFAYISSCKIDNTSRSMSQTSSYDRVTVIDKQDEFSNICQQFEHGYIKTRTSKDNVITNRHVIKNKPKKRKNSIKSLSSPVPKENDLECVPLGTNDLILPTENEQEYDKNTCISIVDGMNSSVTNIDNRKQSTVECTLVPAKESFTHSDNSGSSKAELAVLDASKLKAKITCGRPPQVKGISRVNFPKTCDPICQVQKRKPRLVTTMPSACMMPKLTQTDIKRRIAAMRFPIVILGKDQVNSSLEIHDYDPPQFNGLDEHIWPFMLKWHDNKQFDSKRIVAKDIVESDCIGKINRKNVISHPLLNSNKTMKGNCEVGTNNKAKYVNNDISTKHKNEPKKATLYSEINCKRPQNKNQESITLLKDKMLNFLFQKKPIGTVVTEDYNNNPIKLIIHPNPEKQLEEPIICNTGRKFDAGTETEIKSIKRKYLESQCIVSRERKPRVKSPPKSLQNGFEYPWAKAKRVNDFIESVIKKIRTGVYYSKDLRYVKRDSKFNCATDIAMQTDHEHLYHIDISPKVTLMKKQTNNVIPGFETSLPGLEIKTLNMNQIAVKHCVTNIMVQFDVTDNISTAVNSKMLPITPVDITESHTRIFKCKTTIVNAMLPAELCSILPKLMKLIDADIKTIRPAFGPGLINKSQSYLSPISELSARTDNTAAPFISTRTLESNVSPLDHLSHAVKTYINGMFSYRHGISKGAKKLNPVMKYSSTLLRETLPQSYTVIDILKYGIRLPLFKENKVNLAKQLKQELTVMLEKQGRACTDLEVYTTKNKRLVPVFKPFNFEDAISEILIKQQLSRLNFCTYIPNVQCLDRILYVNITVPNESSINIITNNLNVSDLLSHDDNDKYVSIQKDSPAKRLDYIKRSSKYVSKIKDQKSVMEFKGNNIRNKRKGFYRLYRKCKSATVMPTDKCISTPLQKIQNLDDFFQVLDSKKILASVFDGNAEKKILASIVEMKNWMTDINPKQALLLLLLMNKKDTPNLVRFRPVLLQGIAVNRITRATELDMEIEVIERENFNKFKEYEGISYLPASVQNHDQLLEELYWIAKTTASDYQKPFDESSERLLKSLLEKRKKLNPSYLRVMARYVGLGLLKQPMKK